jgi:hypothetical protein
MPRLTPTALWALILLAGSQPTCAGSLPAGLLGLWRVEDSACQGCDPDRGAETGAELRIASRGFQNPFGADCPDAVDITALAPEPVAELQARLGLPARWLTGSAAALPAQPYRVSCPGRAATLLILLPGDTLLLPIEASTVLRLLRRP